MSAWTHRLTWIRAGLAAVLAVAWPLDAGMAQDAAATDLPPINLPGIRAYAPAQDNGPQAQRDGRLTLVATLIEGSDPIPRGIVWRVFLPTPGDDGQLPLLASAEGGTARFDLGPGSYLVHAAFGRAGVTKRVTINAGETRAETMAAG